jgi:hypothetical protein
MSAAPPPASRYTSRSNRNIATGSTRGYEAPHDPLGAAYSLLTAWAQSALPPGQKYFWKCTGGFVQPPFRSELLPVILP